MTMLGRVLWLAGCGLVVVGTLLPYAGVENDGDQSILDFDHLGTTWAFALSFLVAAAAVPIVALVARGNAPLAGGFMAGAGLVVFLDFLGAYVIGPSTFDGSDLGLGPVLGAIGAALIVGAGVVTVAGGTDRAAGEPRAAAGIGEPRLPLVSARWLTVFLVAVLSNAVLGIAVILFGDFSSDINVAVKLLGSSLSITAGILVGIACEAARTRGLLAPIPLAGEGLAIAGFAVLIAAIWAQPDSGQLWKIAGTLVVAALACAYASLVSRTRLVPLHPIRLAALVLALVFTIVNISAIWTGTGSGEFWRLYGVIGLAFAAGTALVPAFAQARTRAPAISA